MTQSKKVVHYSGEAYIFEGHPAWLEKTIDHPGLSNSGKIVKTSTVLKVLENGSFETDNTIYQKVEQLNG